MYAGEAISRNIRFVDNILPESKDGKERRARHEEYLQDAVTDHWLRRDWGWTYKENSSFAVTAASQKALVPTDFMEIGRDGGVYLAGTQLESKLDEVSPRQIQVMRRAGRVESPPTVFAFWDSDLNGRRYMQFANGSDTTLHLNYRRKPPLVVDKPLALVAAAGAVGVLNGIYNWAVSFVTADGESELGFLSNQLTLALLQANLTDIAISSLTEVTARRIYRNSTGSSVMKLEETLANNTSTSLTTNVADGALGAAHPSGGVIYTGLEIFPFEHYQRVIRPYLRYRALEDRGDARGEVWKGRFEEGLGWAAKTEVQAKATQQRVAGFGLEHMF